jgi:alkylation response protein AidB-like acyl-CoA dehydrogenase
VALGVSVHTLSCFPLAQFGTAEQKDRWLADLLGGDLLGAYCLSEAGSGSDAAALTTKAVRDATTTWSTARKPGSPTAARPTSTT